MRPLGLCLLLLLPALLLVAPSRAVADKARDLAAARQHLQKGQELLKRRMHRAAIVEFQAAYDASEQPNMLYNIGEVYRTLAERSDGTPADAQKGAEYLRQFLAERPEDPERTVIEQRIAALEARAGLARPASPGLAPPPQKAPVTSTPTVNAPARVAPGDEAAAAATATAVRPASEPAADRGGRPLALEIALGGGIALGLAAAGVGAYALAVDGQPGCTLMAPALHCRELVDSTTVGAVLVSAGAAVAIGSLVGLLLVERRARSEERGASAVRLGSLGAALTRDSFVVGAGGAW